MTVTSPTWAVSSAWAALADRPAVRLHTEGNTQHDVFLAGLVGQVQQQLNQLRQDFNLPDVSNVADQQLAAEMAEWDQ